MREQPGQALGWEEADAQTATPHHSGKVAVVGYTPQLTGEVLDMGFLVCIDTNCARGGWLTALVADTGRIWQADRAGRSRTKWETSRESRRPAEPGAAPDCGG